MQANKNNMATVAKTQGKKKKKSIISKQNKNVILRAYISLYNAFLLKNLMSGQTLGASSHKALQLLRAKIATMDKKNPVTKLLWRIHKYHTKVVSKRVMTSPHRDKCAMFRPEQRAKVAALVSKKFKTATATLNSMLAQYKPKQKVVAKPAQTQQNLILLIKMKQMQNQNQRSAA